MDLKISQMQDMQRELWEKHKDKWQPLEPYYARDSLLWMFEEIGECIAIIKKRGEGDIVGNPQVREAFVEELADVYMYFNDVFMRYGIGADEISQAYIKKHAKNMKRDFALEHQKYLEKE